MRLTANGHPMEMIGNETLIIFLQGPALSRISKAWHEQQLRVQDHRQAPREYDNLPARYQGEKLMIGNLVDLIPKNAIIETYDIAHLFCRYCQQSQTRTLGQAMREWTDLMQEIIDDNGGE
jgi:hypothetical protein